MLSRLYSYIEERASKDAIAPVRSYRGKR